MCQNCSLLNGQTWSKYFELIYMGSRKVFPSRQRTAGTSLKIAFMVPFGLWIGSSERGNGRTGERGGHRWRIGGDRGRQRGWGCTKTLVACNVSHDSGERERFDSDRLSVLVDGKAPTLSTSIDEDKKRSDSGILKVSGSLCWIRKRT